MRAGWMAAAWAVAGLMTALAMGPQPRALSPNRTNSRWQLTVLQADLSMRVSRLLILHERFADPFAADLKVCLTLIRASWR